MPKTPYPSELADRYILRMPDGMRERIREAAAANNRSMNAEIVARLEDSFVMTDTDMVGTMKEMTERSERLVSMVTDLITSLQLPIESETQVEAPKPASKTTIARRSRR